jgi:hypothetical protein
VRAGIAWFGETYGEPGLTAVVGLASPSLASLLRAGEPALGLVTSGWYDTQLVGELLGLVERVACPADSKVFGAKLADAVGRDNVGGVNRPLFRLVSAPAIFAANAQRVWRTYVDEGTLSVRLVGPASFEARVSDWTRHHVNACEMMRGMLESTLRAVGYKDLVIGRSECLAKGGPHCQLDGAWKP